MSEELSAPCREKYWSELNESEQIERLWIQLKFVSEQIGELQHTIRLLNDRHKKLMFASKIKEKKAERRNENG